MGLSFTNVSSTKSPELAHGTAQDPDRADPENPVGLPTPRQPCTEASSKNPGWSKGVQSQATSGTTHFGYRALILGDPKNEYPRAATSP
jgi:hypothetical protein